MTEKLECMTGEVIETDFLIIGGGCAGCMAALRAKQNSNIDVAIMERSVIKYSGDVFGYDDYSILIPHPSSKGGDTFGSSLKKPELLNRERQNYFKPISVLEQIGVQVREDDGTFKMNVHHSRVPGSAPKTRPVPDKDGKITADLIFYRGTDFKQKLAQAVRKSGTRVFDRTLLTGLITQNGSIAGATAINTRTGKFIIFKAKTVLLSTGGAWRLYLYPYGTFPQQLFHHSNFPLNHGGGIAAAYRAGVKLVNMEFVTANVSPAGFGRSGGISGNYYLRTKNYKGEIVEQKYLKPGVHKSNAFSPNMETPEFERDVLFADKDSATEDDIIATYFTAATEWPRSLKFLKLRGGVKEGPPVETRLVIRGLVCGVGGIQVVNDLGETSVKNLFTAGDTSGGAGGGCSNALVWGYLIGDYVKELAAGIEKRPFGSEQLNQIEKEKKRVLAPMGRKGDINPLELEDYARKINSNYVGIHKIESRMRRDIDLMKIIKEKYIPALEAGNLHDLTHTVEVDDIVLLSELHAQTSILRTESRLIPQHYRMDYPNPDDANWKNKVITVENITGQATYGTEKLSQGEN